MQRQCYKEGCTDLLIDYGDVGGNRYQLRHHLIVFCNMDLDLMTILLKNVGLVLLKLYILSSKICYKLNFL